MSTKTTSPTDWFPLRRLAAACAVLVLSLIAPACADTEEVTQELTQELTQGVYVYHEKLDVFNNVIYDVTFFGTLTAQGSTGYVLDGFLFGSCNEGPLFTEYATLGHGPASSSYTYLTFDCSNLDKQIHITGTRPVGDQVDVRVGGTSGLLNTYQYGARGRYDIDP